MNTRFFTLLRFAAGLAACLAAGGTAAAQSIIIDHRNATLQGVPASAVQRARETLHIAYGHTSHGSQLVSGMSGLVGFMNAKDDDAFPDNAFAFNSGGTNGALDLRDTPFSGANDLGSPNRTAWASATRTYLRAHTEVNVIIWSWCGQVDGTEAEIDTYLTLMNDLEREFPAVRFVYMTGHLNGGGASGNVNVRNNQIRAYCRANGKVLYDFADIESYDPDGQVNYMERMANDNCDYDSDGNGSRDRNWATVWQAAHVENVDWYSCSAAHSQPLNGNRKAYAAWQLWARLAGWSGPTADTTPPTAPTSLRTTANTQTRVDLAWNAATDAESGIGVYRVLRGGAQIGQTAQTSYADTTVAPGSSYSYTVIAVNGAGLASSPSGALAVTTPGDATAPSVPAGVAVAPVSSRSLRVSWTASTDNVGVTGYVVRRDGASVGTTASTTWTDTGLLAGRSYRYTVSARDAAGNESAASIAVDRAPTPDPIVPGVSAPATLSAAGFFRDLETLTASADLVPYEVNLPAWSDYAQARRWVRRAPAAARMGFAADGPWQFPEGTLWIQQYDVETVCGDPQSRLRLETRVLLRTADGVCGLSYRWNEGQTDAELVPESGATVTYTRCDGPAAMEHPWQIPSRASCASCHTAAGGYALGFTTRQLNRSGPAGSGISDQIAAFAAAGMIDATPPASTSLPRHPRLVDTTVALEARARAWLDVNCAACHQPGGRAGFDLRASTPLAQSGLVDAPVTNTMGDPAMRVLSPDHPEHSALAVRSELTGANRMPAVGRSESDPLGAAVLREWVHRLAQPASAAEARLDNLSTRGLVQSGDSVMIGGFVVAGSGPRQILLRGVGPGLASLDVPGVLPDPQIELFRGGQSLGSNDNWWAGADAAEIRSVSARCGAFAFTEGSLDAAMLVTLEPGPYTVHLRGGAGADAVAMFEAYDASPDGGSRFVNLSTRLRLGSGDRIAIPGLVVGGETRRSFLIRAVGPGLAALDVAGALGDPTIALVSRGELVASNDDWGSPDGGAAIALAAREVGAFALTAGSRDAALLVTLEPGIYTVVTSAAAGAQGIVLVEIYEVL